MLGYICTTTLFNANTKRMTLKFLPFKATLNKAYQKLKPTRSEMERFKSGLVKLLDNIDHSESEENHKFHLQNFLNEVWYKDAHLIAPKGNIDLVIHEERSAQSPAVVLFEVKRERNLGEMIRPDSPNAKALHELILYYLRERVNAGNIYVKHLVITNIYDWYIFDGATFDRLFYQNKKLLKDYDRWRNDQTVLHTTDFFYKDIAKRYLEEMAEELVAAHFNLKEYLRYLPMTAASLPLTPKGEPTDAHLSELQNRQSTTGGTNTGSPLGVRGNDKKGEPTDAHLSELQIRQSTTGGTNTGSPLGVRGNDDKPLIPLFKILSPQHLLRLPFANDSNSLNEGFYRELLYLIGLEEEKEGGKKLIRRCATERRHSGSLLENTINIIQYEDRMRHVRSNDVFEVGLELCITWVNRLLFLKLLESQLVKYHGGLSGGGADYRFLTSKLLKDFDGLNKLFFQVLAGKVENRPAAVLDSFAKVPYLNSSLFEITEMEGAAIRINSLEDELTLPLHPKSVLRNSGSKGEAPPMAALHYIFAFLDAYDFASEGGEEVQEENKALINASVLGLIFEKINGYRDGSFFTPGFITMYMCRETVRRAVMQKFNQHYGIDCADFGDLCNFTAKHYKKEDVLANNRLVNSLRICDPAVGSGHFLVSALNELIAVKSELGILADADGNVLRGYAATVENDELVVTCNDGQDLFEYRTPRPPKEGDSPQSNSPFKGWGGEAQKVQETIFHEKQTLIENCLFGVDINPNSVKICRLRLWIELLKNTYYIGGTDAGGLETLPNIDINIKVGNSLISRFALDTDLSKVVKSKNEIQDYRRYVQEYHHATDKDTKRGLLAMIEKLKGDFRTEIHRNDKLNKQKSKLAGELYNLTQQGSLFGMTEAEAKKRKTEADKLEKELEKLETQIMAIQENKIYENAFEWRFEFPEVLDAEGKFVGFDVVVGNPPYDVLEKERNEPLAPHKSLLDFANANEEYLPVLGGKLNIYRLFIAKALRLLKGNGEFNFIVPLSILADYSCAKSRLHLFNSLNYLKTTAFPQKDIASKRVFEDAKLSTTIITGQKRSGESVDEKILIITYPFNSFKDKPKRCEILLNDLELIDKESLPIPLIDQTDWDLIKYLHNRESVNRLGEVKDFEIRRGEINQTIFREYITENPNDVALVKGVEIGQYRFNLKLSQGKKEWFNERGFLEKNKSQALATLTRIATQRITGIDERLRIVATIVNPVSYFADSTNSITIDEKSSLSLLYLLGLLNSKLFQWAFKLTSTNNNVGTNELKNLPFEYPSLIQMLEIETLVTQILAAKQADAQADTTALEGEVDRLVYGLYGLGEEEVRIIEGTSKQG